SEPIDRARIRRGCERRALRDGDEHAAEREWGDRVRAGGVGAGAHDGWLGWDGRRHAAGAATQSSLITNFGIHLACSLASSVRVLLLRVKHLDVARKRAG